MKKICAASNLLPGTGIKGDWLPCRRRAEEFCCRDWRTAGNAG